MRPVQNRLCQTVAVTLALGFVACTDTDNPLTPPVRALYTTPTGLLTANPPQIFTGAGDISSCSNTGDEATAKLLDAIPEGFVYNIGDDAYNNGTTAEFACYNSTWGRHKARTYPTTGNHEYNTSGATGYYQYFGAAGHPSSVADSAGFYSFNLGAWHIISLNSSISRSSGSKQDKFLAADLAAHPNQCILAYWHHPLYSSTGGSGSGGVSIASMRPFWDRLYAAHADLVLNGHRHFYERLKPMKPDGSLDLANGITEIIAGSGGIGGGSETNLFPTHVTGDGSTFGVLKLYLYDDSFAWKFVPVAGKTYTDSGSTACHSSGGGGGGAGPVDPGTSSVSANPTSFTAGSGSSTITVTARDASNNLLSGQSVTLASTGNGNGFSPSSGTTDGSGVFTSTFTSSVAEGKTISANIAGTAITQTAAVTVTSSGGGGGGTIAQTLLTSGTNAVNQSVYTTASIAPAANALVTVAVLGRRSSGALTPTISGGGIGTWQQVASVDYDPVATPASRLVVFRGMSGSPGSGPITITFTNSMSNATWMVSQWTGVDPSGTNGSGAIGQTGTAAGDGVTSLSKTLGGFGNANNVGFAVVGVSANAPFVAPGAGSTEIGETGSGESTDLETQSGVNDNAMAATFNSADNGGLLAIEIKAGSSGLVVSPTNSTVSAASPITAGGSSTIDVTVEDGSGNPMSGVAVTLSATGSNSITQPAATTDLSGHTSGSLSATVAGSNTVTAVAGGVTLSTHPVVVVNPGPQSKLAFSVQPSTTASGAAITPAVQVQIQDGFGNQVNSSDNVTVAIGTDPSGSATLSGTLTVAASGGTASFADVSINNPGTGYTLTAASGVLTGATSNAFNISATPAQLGFFVQPSNAAAGAAIAPPVQVEIQDNGGNRVTTATNTVTMDFGNNAGSGTLSGTLSVAAVSGVATFGNLSINNAATGYTLQATATSLTAATSGSFDITPPVAGSITQTLLTAGSDITNQKIYTTASIAPAANALITLAVIGHTSTAASASPTVTGGGMSAWVEVATTTFNSVATPLKRMSIFRAMSASPGSGPITISFPTTESNAAWVVSQWTGVDQTGTNGSGAIVQTATNRADAVSSIGTTLAALSGPNNVAYGAVGTNGSALGINPGAGFTEISEQKPPEGTATVISALFGTNQTAPSASWTGSFAAAILAVEIKAGP